jgi:hypothetical protein
MSKTKWTLGNNNTLTKTGRARREPELRTGGDEGSLKCIGPIAVSAPKGKKHTRVRLTLDAHETGEQQAIKGGGETDAENGVA